MPRRSSASRAISASSSAGSPRDSAKVAARHDEVGPCLEEAGAVAEGELAGRRGALHAAVEELDLDEDVADRAPVGAGVADDGAADRARDVAGELEAGESLPGQVGDQAGQLGAGLHAQHVVLERVPLVAREDDESREAVVADEHVGGAAEDGERHPELAREAHRVRERVRVAGSVEELGGAADAIGAEGRERHGLFEAGQLAPQDLAHVVHAGIVASPRLRRCHRGYASQVTLTGEAMTDDSQTAAPAPQGFETLALHAGQEPDPTTERARRADLPDHLLRLQRHRPRRQPLRAARSSATSTRAS